MIQATEEKQGVTRGRERDTKAVKQATEEGKVAQQGSRCEKDAGNTHRMMSCERKAQRDNVSER